MSTGEWLVDNAGIVIGASVGLLGISVALLIYFWQRRPKRLDYTIMYNAPVLSPRALEVSDLKVVYDDHELASPHVVTVRVKNTGKESVEGDDYHQCITISYTEGGPPLDASVPRESSPGLVGIIGFNPDERQVDVAPGLLNPGEWFELQMISDGSPGDVNVSSRFVGQTRAMRDLDPTPKKALLLVLAGMTVVVAAAFVSGISGSDGVFRVLSPVGIGIFLAGMSYVFYRIARTPSGKNEDGRGVMF